jgi:hypothetical protein
VNALALSRTPTVNYIQFQFSTRNEKSDGSSLKSLGAIVAEAAAENQSTFKAVFQVNCQDKFLEGVKSKMIFNILDNYAYPEVMRRTKDGKLYDDFRLHNVHLVMFADETKNHILLNDEARFITNIEFRHGVKYRPNERVRQGDIIKVLGLYSESRNDPNSAHIILFKCNDIWYCSYDLIYDRKRVKARLELAKTFIKAATYCLESKLSGAFVDTLYSATELAIQSILLLHHNPKFSLNQTHDETRELFSNHTRLGNVDTKYSNHYIKLDELRKQGRYLNGTHGRAFSIKNSKATILLLTTKGLLTHVERLITLIDLSKKPPDGHYISVGRIKQQL